MKPNNDTSKREHPDWFVSTTTTKHLVLARLREEGSIGRPLPDISVEDWVLACIIRKCPNGWSTALPSTVAGLQPENARSATGKILLGKIITALRCWVGYRKVPVCERDEYMQSQPFFHPSFDAFDRFYRKRAQEHPECAEECRAVRKHLARLRKIPYKYGDCTCEDIRRWGHARRTALNPSPQVPTEELVQQFTQARESIVAMRQEIADLKKKILDKTRIAHDLLDELAIRHYPIALSIPAAPPADLGAQDD